MPFNGFVDEFSNAPVQPAFSSYLGLTLTDPVVLEWSFQNPNTLYPFSQTIEIITSDAVYGISLPDATVSSVGQTVCFVNTGANNVEIYDYDVNLQATIEPAQQWYMTLTDNSASAGIWLPIQLGATTSEATAGSLVDNSTDGNGHQNNGGISAFASNFLKMNQRVNTFNGVTYNQESGDRGSLLVWSGGNGTYNCLSASDVGNGYNFSIHNASTTGGTITVTPDGANTIDGESSFTLAADESATFISNGTSAFYSLGFGQQFTNIVTEAEVPLSDAVDDIIEITQDQAKNLILNFTGTSGSNPYPDITIALPDNFVNQYYLQNSSTTNDVLIQVGTGETTYVSRITTGGNRILGFTDLSNFYNIPNIFEVDELSFGDGSEAAPSITFTNDTTTGIYRHTTAGANIGAVTITENATDVAYFKDGRTQLTTPCYIPSDGNGYSFTNATTTGMIYDTGTTSLVLQAGGTSAVSISNTETIFTVSVIGEDATFSGAVSVDTLEATSIESGSVNVTGGQYTEEGINIYSIMRAYG